MGKIELCIFFVGATLLFAPLQGVFAQEHGKAGATLPEKEVVSDSIENELIKNASIVHKTLEKAQEKYKKNKLSRFFSRLFFKRSRNIYVDSVYVKKNVEKSKFEIYEGKIIREIKIISISPCESCQIDSVLDRKSTKAKSEFAKLVNSLHVETFPSVLRRNLFFKAHDTLNSRVLDENLAYIRSLPYIYDSQFVIDSISCDSVDITLVSRDNVAFQLDVDRLDDRRIEVELSNKNIFGTGTLLSAGIIYSRTRTPHLGYRFKYSAANILGTFFNAKFHIQSVYNKKRLNMSVSRNIVPGIDNIAGFSYNYEDVPQYLRTLDTTRNIAFENGELWIGKVFYPLRDKSLKLVAQVAYLQQQMISKDLPNINDKVYEPYEHSRMYLFKLSLFRQRFHSNRFVYSYGANESTPIGFNVSTQFGYADHKYFDRFYGSVFFSFGQQLKKGYHYHTIQIGSFFNKGKPEQGVFKISANYFSNLFKWGKIRARQFVNIDYTAGIHRLSGEGDYLYITDQTQINLDKYKVGYDGAQRLRLSTETTLFTNASILGSRLVCLGFAECGFIGTKNDLFSNKFFYGFGVGIRLGNEFMIFKSIEIKFGYYPRIIQKGISDFIDFSRVDKFSPRDFSPKQPEVIPFY